jgi:drug/metabolite transporter (DMT)-like permease
MGLIVIGLVFVILCPNSTIMLNLITLAACLGSTLSIKEIEHLFDVINAFYQVPCSIKTKGAIPLHRQ